MDEQSAMDIINYIHPAWRMDLRPDGLRQARSSVGRRIVPLTGMAASGILISIGAYRKRCSGRNKSGFCYLP